MTVNWMGNNCTILQQELEWRRRMKARNKGKAGWARATSVLGKVGWRHGKGRQQPGIYANVAFPENLKKKKGITVRNWAEINMPGAIVIKANTTR